MPGPHSGMLAGRMSVLEERASAERRRRNISLVLGAVAAAIASALVHPFDQQFSAAAIERMPSSLAALWFFLAIKSMGKADTLAIVLLLACLTRLRRPAVQGLAGLVLIALPVLLIKHFFHRDRPMHSGSSFPSGDTASAVVAFVPLAIASPKLRWPLVGLMALVALFRIVAGYHYPSDVLAGAALGMLASIVALSWTPRNWLRPGTRTTWVLLVLAGAACGFIAATGSGQSPSKGFALLILPFVLLAVILERRRLARLQR